MKVSATAVLTLVLCAMAFAQSVAPGAPAVEDVRVQLQYVGVSDMDNPIVSRAGLAAPALNGRPAKLDVADAPLEGKTAFYRLGLPWGTVVMAVNLSKPCLVADADGDGSLKGEKAYPGSAAASSMYISGTQILRFGPVSLKTPGADGGEAKVQVFCIGGRAVKVHPAGFVTGRAVVSARPYDLGIVDANYDGVYDGVFGARNGCDLLAVDWNGDKRVESDGDAGELIGLPKMLEIGGRYCALAVERDGSAASLSPAEPVMGTLEASSPDVALSLWSDSGFHRVSGSNGSWSLPVGVYATSGVTVTVKDKRGGAWSAKADGISDKLAGFAISADQPTALVVGPPFVLKADVQKYRGLVSVGLTMIGQGGESYGNGVYVGARRGQPPDVRILNDAEKIIAQGAFAYG